MFLKIGDVIAADTLAVLRRAVDGLSFTDGRATAGWAARDVKANRQAKPTGALQAVTGEIEKAILAHEVFQAAVRPRTLTPLILARYGAGEAYGNHVDDALMRGLRTDVSFTLFLADPESYDGGALILDMPGGEEHVKLPAGALFCYPSTTLHRVEPVTRGERIVAVGWARSFIRMADQRETLFDLDRARRMVFEREGKSESFDLISKSLANLIRRWAED